MRKRLKMFLAVVVVIFVSFEVFIFSLPLLTKPDKCDVIVVLGCRLRGETPSVFLKARTEEAAKLFKQGYGKYIIVSGGKGEGEDISEAEGMKRILLQNGVEEDKIILEDKSRNTAENIKFSSQKMKENNFNNAVIVSNDYHLRRAWILCKKNDLSATYKGVFVKEYAITEAYGAVREIPATVKDLIIN